MDFRKCFKGTEKRCLQLKAYSEVFKLANKHILMAYQNLRFKVYQLYKIWRPTNTQTFLQMTLTSSVMIYFDLFS